MRVVKYLAPFCAGIILYSLSAVFLGKTGLRAYDFLLHEKEMQLENLEMLGGINTELKGARDALSYDADTIAVYARELGFGAEDERFIRIVGLDKIHKQQITEGEIYQGGSGTYIEDKTLRAAAICFAVIIFLFMVFNDILKNIAAVK